MPKPPALLPTPGATTAGKHDNHPAPADRQLRAPDAWILSGSGGTQTFRFCTVPTFEPMLSSRQMSAAGGLRSWHQKLRRA
jgi:hypothetical protein